LSKAENLVLGTTDLDSVVSVNVEVDCQKQQTYCLRLHVLDFAIANLYIIPQFHIEVHALYSLESSCSACFV